MGDLVNPIRQIQWLGKRESTAPLANAIPKQYLAYKDLFLSAIKGGQLAMVGAPALPTQTQDIKKWKANIQKVKTV